MSEFITTKHVFAIADTMALTLERKGSIIQGKGINLFKVGPWSLDRTIKFYSDEVHKDCVSGMIHISEDLWGYVVSKGDDPSIFLFLFDGSLLGLKDSNALTYTSSHQLTLKKLEKGVVVSYSYEKNTKKWIKIDSKNPIYMV